MADQGMETFGLDIPMLNRRVIDYLLGRSYQVSPFFLQQTIVSKRGATPYAGVAPLLPSRQIDE
jgi:predicted SPOUT superfamily RNA methylase MTH1